MRVVDMHQHLWPRELIAALRRRTEPPRLDGSTLQLDEGRYAFDAAAHDPERRLEELDRDGVEVAVVSLQPTLAQSFPPEVLGAYHEGIGQLAARSGGRVVALSADGPADGFAGVCLSPRDLGDLDAVAGTLDELERSARFLFVHPGPATGCETAPAWWAPGVDYVTQMQVAYGRWHAYGEPRWPHLRVVFAILAGGAPFQLERLAKRGLDVRQALSADVYLDTASYGRRAFELCLATYGVGRIVYGSDAPVMDPRPMLRELRTFGAAVTAAVCAENPERLLG